MIGFLSSASPDGFGFLVAALLDMLRDGVVVGRGREDGRSRRARTLTLILKDDKDLTRVLEGSSLAEA